MAQPPHLVVDISAHGFGHLAMTGPVIDAIAARVPDLQFTIRTALPAARVAQHVRAPFRHVDQAFDFGMVMVDALTIDTDASFARYVGAHTDWERRVDEATAELAGLRPTSLLGNIPYLSLIAARRAGVPAFGFCCLNWAEVFHAYCGTKPGAAAIERQIREAYAAAECFIRARPAIPMPDLARTVDVGPVGRIARPRREALRAALGLPEGRRVALLSTGGFDMPLDVSAWPDLGRWTVLAGMPVTGRHPAVLPLDAAGMPWIDAFASCDAVITKLGYGTVAEAGLNGVPLLHVPRPGWPEEPTLGNWLAEHGRAAPIALADLLAGCFVPALERLVALPVPPRPEPGGIGAAAGIVADSLLRRRQAVLAPGA